MQASYLVTSGDEFISIRADAKLRSSADGSTSWTDVAGSNAAVVDGWAYLHITPPKGWREQQGSVSINVTADSLPPGSYWFDVVARVASGDGSIDRRSEERRGGKEWVSTCRARWSPAH